MSDNDDCPICLESHNTTSIKLQNCIHKFHAECLKNWILEAPLVKNNFECPFCRTKNSIDQVVSVNKIVQLMYPVAFGLFIGTTFNLMIRCNLRTRAIYIWSTYLFPGSQILQHLTLFCVLTSTQTKATDFVSFYINNYICSPLILQPFIKHFTLFYLDKKGAGYLCKKTITTSQFMPLFFLGTTFGCFIGAKFSKFINYLAGSMIAYF